MQESFGGPELLELREVEEPHPGPGEVRVRVAAAGLNPMDWLIPSSAELARGFGYTLPSGFGHDFAGTVDEVGNGVEGFAVGDRVYGGVPGRAVADFALARPDAGRLFHTPSGIDDVVASTLTVAGLSAVAALDAIDPRAGDTVLIGGAAGGVGVYAVQLARIAGATVIGTCSEGTFDFLRGLGARPVTYGTGLADRVRAMAPAGLTAATDLFGSEAMEAALELGVAPERISTIIRWPEPPDGVRVTGGGEAAPGALERVTEAILAGKLTVPIAATFPIEQIHEAVTLQAGRHVHGKVVIVL
jgi:NADPH:quinone reductase-like Zn-dependent oxidoreductase